MIIADKTNKVQFQGNFDTIKVGIDEKNISHFFRMIANLYQDPVTAVLREIGANCVDAIKEAKTQKLGWELHLPSRFDGNVRFVDNGVGISHEQMIRIYSIIGASSKREDNNLIGGFGVGKWSLCSIVNNFQAISTYNGTKSTYFICLQSNGLPDIKVIKQEQTNDRNGFEVKFLCPDKYVGEFNSKVPKTYRFFDIKPKVFSGGVQQAIDYGSEKILFDAKQDIGCQIFEGSGDAVIVMGGVGYRIPRENLAENKKFAPFAHLLNRHMVIHVPIGEYSITPSREAIQLDDLTLTRLHAKLSQIVDAFIPKLQKDMDKFDGNTWSAKNYLRKLRENFSFLPDTIQLTWEGKPLTAASIKIKTSKVKSYYNQAYARKKILSDDKVSEMVPNEKHFVFLDDLGLGGVGRVKQFLINKKAGGDSWGSYLVYLVKKADKDAFVAETGWIGEFEKTSALPPVPKQVKASSVVSDPRCFRMRSNNSWGTNECLMELDEKDSKIKAASRFILFPTFANKIANHSTTRTDALVELFTKHYGEKVVALFLPVKQYDEFEMAEVNGVSVVKIHDTLKEKEVIKFIRSMQNKMPWNKFDHRFHNHANSDWNLRGVPRFIMRLCKMTSPNHLLSQFAEKVLTIAAENDGCEYIPEDCANIIRHIDKDVLQNTDSVADKTIGECVDLCKKITQTYPLIRHAAHDYHHDSTQKDVILYVKLIDKYNEINNKNK